MLHILLLAVQALPAYVPYKDQVVPIDFDSATGLAVGTDEKCVSKVVEALRWANLTSINQRIGAHDITSWRAGRRTKGVYLTHITNGQNWKTYVPDIDSIRAVTAANLDSLLAMYNAISQSPGMKSKELFDFVVPPAVKTFLETETPSTQEITAVLPLLNPTLEALEVTICGLHPVNMNNRGDEQINVLYKQHELQKENLIRQSGPFYLEGSDEPQKVHIELEEKQYEERQKRKKKFDAEQRQACKQRSEMETVKEKLRQKIAIMLTLEVAETLPASNSSAVKGFLELFLQNGAENQEKITSELARKIGRVTSLDLRHARSHLLSQILEQNREFLQLFTFSKTLSTVADNKILKQLLKQCQRLLKENQLSRKEEAEMFFSEHKRLLLTPIYARKAAQDAKRYWACKFPEDFTSFLDSTEGLNSQLIREYVSRLNDENLSKYFWQYFAKQVENFVEYDPKEQNQRLVKEMANAQGPNQQKWQHLERLLDVSQESERVFRAEQATKHTIYAGMFVCVVTEIKRRFDVAEQTAKQELTGIAKAMWAPGYDDDESQERIRAISPQAARMLAEMAK